MSDCEPDNLLDFEPSGIKVFGGSSNPELVNRVCASLKVPVGQAHVGRFPDGETIIKLDDDVRGRDCFVVQSSCPPVNENLMELLIFIDCLRRASARRITAVIPYFGYARQDRKAEGRTPITAKLVANLITQAGAHRVLAMDLHADQIQGFFDLPVDHLTAMPVIAQHVVSLRLQDTVVVSPDVGNVKQASVYKDRLGTGLAIIEKHRLTGDTTKASRVIGDVGGKTVLMFDDMITTGGTATEAMRILRNHGAKRFLLAATHAVLAGPALDRLVSANIDWVLVTDTIPLGEGVRERLPQIQVLSVAPLLGEAIRRIHCNASVSAMFQNGYVPSRGPVTTQPARA
ncbi:MAG: ribose-phosphate pyrophosphokinase [Phycisphaerae bacterium]|jgi:ribose-phosphate pyrophosphokinase